MIVTVLYILYAIFFGILDGYLWGRVTDFEFRMHPHKIASAIRLIIIMLISWHGLELRTLYFSIAYVLLFSLFHNGFYYTVRGIRDKVPGYSFTTSANTSTGFKFRLFGKEIHPFEFGFYNRLIQFAIGIIIIILINVQG